jgi:hypothetical protein
VLKINDLTESGVLAIDLKNLIALILSEGQRLTWRAFPMAESMEIVGDLTPLGTNAVEFEQRVDASESGVALRWDDLVTLAGCIDQTIWGMFLGCQDAAAFAGSGRWFLDDWHYLDRAARGFYASVEIGFQAVDSSYWFVYARDAAVRERIRSAFTNVEVVIGNKAAQRAKAARRPQLFSARHKQADIIAKAAAPELPRCVDDPVRRRGE